MTRLFIGILDLFLVSIALLAQVPQNPTAEIPELLSLKQKYEEAIKPIEARSEGKKERLRNDYIGVLDKGLKDTMAEGNLDTSLAIKAERERIAKNEEPTEEQKKNMPPVMASLRSNYDKGLKRISNEAANESQQVFGSYLSSLQTLEKSLTMRGDLESAIAVRAEREKCTSTRGASVSQSLSPPINLIREMNLVNQCQREITNSYVVLTAPNRDMTFVQSREKYRPPFTFKTRAQTDSTNIRLYYAAGILIFNWESAQQELRVHDPKTGQITGVKNQGFISPNKWHDITWEIRKNGMRVLVDGDLRYEAKGDYAGLEAPVAIGPSWGSTVSVESLFIEPLKQKP